VSTVRPGGGRAGPVKPGDTLKVMPQLDPPLEAPKRLLFGPGPSPVAPRVYQAMQQNVVGHLDPFFFQVADEIRELLGYVFSTANLRNLAVSGTGSSGMEAAVANFTEPGPNSPCSPTVLRRPHRRNGAAARR